MRSTKGGGDTVQQWPSSPDDSPTYEEGSLRIQRPPPAESCISPPEHHISSRASVDPHDAGHLDVKHTVLHKDA